MPSISQAYLASLTPEKRRAFVRSHVSLGVHPETEDYLMLPENDRYAGTYVLGVQGTGKSSLLEQMIHYDMQIGNAVIVIDPHGDLTSHCIAQLPWDVLDKTYLLDMEDENYPFGVNLFATGRLTTDLKKTQAVSRILHVFEVLWPEVMSQQHLPRYVRAAILTLLDNPGTTMVDMLKLLVDDDYRSVLVGKVEDDSVRNFWKDQYDTFGDAERARRVQSLANRLEALFMGRALVRNIVGQRKTSINFRAAIERKEILFIQLPVKTLSQDARLVGTILMSQIQNAVFSFADVPAEKRPGVSLYVDEFQHFATSDFSELLTEGRKFGVRVTVAHQYRNQLPSFLQESTMTARTKICFQTTPEDGREMAHLFPASETTIKPDDIEPHPVNHLLTYGNDDPYTQVFIDTYLRPLQGQRRGYRVEIKQPGFNLGQTLGDMLITQDRSPNPRVEDPTPYLDHLLYQVMYRGDATLPIPFEAVKGFSNCGISFYQQLNMVAPDLLAATTKFPPHLVISTDSGPRFTKRPTGGREQLYHFLFHLRMTMVHLEEHPIGKATSPNSSDVAQMLMHLPRRSAFVRSAETVGVMYTFNTPPEVSKRDFTDRVAVIREQTRAKYCHQREEVEGGLREAEPHVVPAAEPGTAAVSRWEEA